MRKSIVAVLALAIAALSAGCSSFTKKQEAPRYAPPAAQIQQLAAAAVPAPKPAAMAAKPASSAGTNQFDPGILSAEQKAQNLKKCEGWEKLSAADKKKKGFFCWQHVGADPYQGKAEAALAQSQWPAEVQQLFLNQIKQGNKAEMILERGMTFDWSTFGKGVSKAFVHRNVVADWKEGEVHSASVFTVSHGGKIYKLYLPRDCGNWSGNVYSVPAPVAVPPVATSVCPDGWSLTANAWSLTSMPDGLRKEAEGLIAAANARESGGGQNIAAYQTPALSRTLGGRLRAEVKVRAPVTVPLAVRYVDIDPQTKVMSTRNIGVLNMVNGIGTFRFADDPRPHIVELIFPQSWRSPTNSGGERRLRILPPDGWPVCGLNAHGVLP